MESVYLRELKSFSVSEVLNFREKYVELINKRSLEADKSQDDNDAVSEAKRKLRELSTEEKIEKKRLKTMDDITTPGKKSKFDSRDLPPIIPMSITENILGDGPRKVVYDLVPNKDVVFVFKFYPPFKYDHNGKNKKCKHNMEIAMLGHQTLNLLCDKIVCGESYMEVGGDISETPDIPPRQRLGEKYKSRMLYIGNTFYVDKSNPNNIDYSEPIRAWGKRRDIHFGETLDMHKSSCLDLVARIGHPYVYQHLGGCEHVFRIEYVRLLEEKDCLESKLYPLYNYLARGTLKLCMACMELCQWIIFDSPRMIANPSFLCNNCFRSYHYINGKKVSTFSAVRYWDCPAFSNIFDNVSRKSKVNSKTSKTKSNEEEMEVS